MRQSYAFRIYFSLLVTYGGSESDLITPGLICAAAAGPVVSQPSHSIDQRSDLFLQFNFISDIYKSPMSDLEFHPSSDDNSENEASSESSDEEEIDDGDGCGEQSSAESSDDESDDVDNDGEKDVSEDRSEELVIVTPDSEQPTAAVKGLEKTKDSKTSKSCVTWNGEKLFRPDSSKGRHASEAWKHGGFKKNVYGQLIKNKVWCSYCGKDIKYTSSPSNFMEHVRNRHLDILIKEEEKNNNRQLTMTDMFKRKDLKVEKYKSSHPKQVSLRKNLSSWIVKEKRPFQIVDDGSFHKIIEDIDPKLSVPSAKTVLRDIRGSFKNERKRQIEKLKAFKFFSCTNDGGTSLANHSFIGINLHWIDENFQARKKLIDMKPVDSKKADDYREAVDKSLDDHKVKDKTFSFTTDNENTMKKSFSKDERTGCFAHIESKACQKSLESSKTLKMVRKKLRKVAKKSNKSPKFKRNLMLGQKKRRISTRTLKQEVPTRFTSTKDMFASFAPSKPREEVDPEEAKKNIEAINSALEKSVKPAEFNSLKISQNDLNVVLNILPLLEILEEGITKIGGKKYSTGSILLPFLSKFLEHLKEDEADLMYVRSFKKCLQEELIKRCKENLNIKVLSMSSICDMRYSHLKFLEVLQQFKVTNITKEMIIDLFKSELETIHPLVADNENADPDVEPQSKKTKKSFLDDGNDIDDIGDKSVDTQVEGYFKEPTIRAAKCPGVWWRENQAKYPTIAKLARKYLSVQGTSTPAERVMSDMGAILNKKRLSMTDENFSILMYLSDIL